MPTTLLYLSIICAGRSKMRKKCFEEQDQKQWKCRVRSACVKTSYDFKLKRTILVKKKEKKYILYI